MLKREERARRRSLSLSLFVLRRNGDAGNMSPTDIRIDIPESASYRPEAHVFPFPRRVSGRDFFSSPRVLRIEFPCRILPDVYMRVERSDLITVKK